MQRLSQLSREELKEANGGVIAGYIGTLLGRFIRGIEDGINGECSCE